MMECKACGHKHDIWDGDELTLTYKETESFFRIEGDFRYVKDMKWSDTSLYACPKCGTVRISNFK